MNTARTAFTRRWIPVFAFVLAVTMTAAYSMPQAQNAAKKAMTVDDYAKWRDIAGRAISGDGRWVAYVLQMTNTIPAEAKPVLHLLNLETNSEVTVDDAADPVFSSDSKWIAYQMDPGAAQRARAARTGSGGAPSTQQTAPPAIPPAPAPTDAPATQQGQGQTGRGSAPAAIPPRRVELRNLETGAVRSWEDIGTFAFAPTSTHLVLRRRGAETAGPTGRRGGGGPQAPAGGAGSASATPGSRGQDAVLLDLRTGGFLLLGSVGEFAFNRSGELLAFTVEAAVKDGNGVFVFDTRNGRVTPLDNDARIYSRLAWNEDGTAVAALKGNEVEKMRERDNVLVAFPDVPASLKDGAGAEVADRRCALPEEGRGRLLSSYGRLAHRSLHLPSIMKRAWLPSRQLGGNSSPPGAPVPFREDFSHP